MRVGIVIGCSTYTDHGIDNLKFANQDAVNFAAVLKDDCGFDEKYIRVLLSTEAAERKADRNNMIRALLPPPRLPPVELLVIFFSGHGIRSARDGKDYVLLEDTQFRALEETALSFEYIRTAVSRWAPKCTLLFFDACRNVVNGAKSLRGGDDEPFHPAELKLPGSAAFFSCARNERSYEIPQLCSGLFSYALMEALGDTGRCRTVSDLSKYLCKRVPLLGAEHGRPEQTPYSIVEPLAISNVILVSRERSLMLDSSAPVGKEIRSGRAADSSSSVHDNGLLAVDFGTSYSLAAFTAEDGTIRYLHTPEGDRTLLSIISFYPGLDYVVGKDVHNAGTADGPCQVVRNFKRLLASNGRVDVLGRDIPAVTLASLLIGSIRRNYEEATGQPVRAAIAAVPANFGIAATNALAHAFYLAGIPLTRIIGEPCAAALNILGRDDLFPHVPEQDLPAPNSPVHAEFREILKSLDLVLEVSGDLLLAVIDVGGGTTDISFVEVARIEGEFQFEVRALHGDNFLGGMDYDQALVELIRQRSRAEFGEAYVERWMSTPDAWLPEAEKIKKQFSISEKVYVPLPSIEGSGGLKEVGLMLDRSEFINVTMHLSEQLKVCLNRLAAHWEGRRGPDYILLAGQGCKIFLVRSVVDEFAGQVPVIDTYQENAVISGLFKQAEVLAGFRKDMLLLDVSYTGLSVACHAITVSESYVDKFGQTRTRTAEVSISTSAGGNAEKCQVFEVFRIIPTVSTVILHINGVVDDVLSIPLYEVFANGEQSLVLGSIIIPPGTQGSLEMSSEIDANGVILVYLFEVGQGAAARGNPDACVAAYIVNRQWTSAISGLLERGYAPLPQLAA